MTPPALVIAQTIDRPPHIVATFHGGYALDNAKRFAVDHARVCGGEAWVYLGTESISTDRAEPIKGAQPFLVVAGGRIQAHFNTAWSAHVWTRDVHNAPNDGVFKRLDGYTATERLAVRHD